MSIAAAAAPHCEIDALLHKIFDLPATDHRPLTTHYPPNSAAQNARLTPGTATGYSPAALAAVGGAASKA